MVRLFEMGFEVQLHEILHRLPPNRQTLLFSATLPKLLVDFAKAGLQEPTLVRLDVDTKISKDLEVGLSFQTAAVVIVMAAAEPEEPILTRFHLDGVLQC